MPGLDAPIISAQAAIDRAADERIAALGGPPAMEPMEPPALPPDGASQAQPEADAAPPPTAEDLGHSRDMQRLGHSVEQLSRNPRGYVRDLLGSAPMAMFITVPLFALMLKLAYLFRGRLYLEHLVVALYSHAWMMLVLLLYFAVVLAGGWLQQHLPWAAAPLSWLRGLLLAAIPVYLLWMQKRVYAQGWPMTLFKFAIVGFAYLLLLVTATSFVALYVLLSL